MKDLFFNEIEESHSRVHKNEDGKFEVWSCSYGSEEMYEGVFELLQEAIDSAKSQT
jgi:hypothetical protein